MKRRKSENRREGVGQTDKRRSNRERGRMEDTGRKKAQGKRKLRRRKRGKKNGGVGKRRGERRI